MPAFVGVIFVWNNFAGAQQSMWFSYRTPFQIHLYCISVTFWTRIATPNVSNFDKNGGCLPTVKNIFRKVMIVLWSWNFSNLKSQYESELYSLILNTTGKAWIQRMFEGNKSFFAEWMFSHVDLISKISSSNLHV